MKQRIKGLERILKVRDTQKKQAETELLKASNRCSLLENNLRRVKYLQGETSTGSPYSEASFLAAKGELADRLVKAERILERSIETARQDFARAERQNFAARSTYDGTEKLLDTELIQAKKSAVLKSNIQNNILYNIDNNRKKDRHDDR